MNSVTPTTLSIGNANPTAQSVVKEVPRQIFDSHYCTGSEIAEDESAFKVDESIYTLGMNDCIAIFSIEVDDEGQPKIGGYHVKSFTDAEEMQEEFFSTLGHKAHLFIIGGNAASTAKGDLLDTIRDAINDHFGNQSCIIGEYTNLIQGTNYIYVNAHFQLDATLTFCKF